ncbi:MAG TPA: hypothetical protein PLY16_02005 [Candidatus Saccharibacteria bacterium]|nr:hypothetical protein [Candidatus Saccharibacteria bacterium]
MKKFILIRNHDQGGVSGTGRVLDGVQFANGKVVVQWHTGKVGVGSTAIWDTIDDFMSVHVTSHPENDSQIIWEDDPHFVEMTKND